MVRLDFSIELDYEVTQASEFDLILHAARTARQKVLREHLEICPAVPYTVEADVLFGNRHTRLHVECGPLKIRYCALVDIDHYFTQPEELREVAIPDLPLDVLHYIKPSRYCPSDQLYAMAVQEFGSLAPGYGRVKAIADWVRGRTRFQAGTTNSSHSALDTLNHQIGVCRDFAHLMISICRALNIPARYVTSIDYGADPALGPMDFHAYVEVYLSDRWYIFDPTGIATSTGLVRLATGRDANDVAFATLFGSAKWTIPRITMVALEDAGAGLALPMPASLALSTTEPAGTNLHASRDNREANVARI